jgi:hypothetical protein
MYRPPPYVSLPLVASRKGRKAPPPYASSQYSSSASAWPASSNEAVAKGLNVSVPPPLASIGSSGASRSRRDASTRNAGS